MTGGRLDENGLLRLELGRRGDVVEVRGLGSLGSVVYDLSREQSLSANWCSFSISSRPK